ncbi:protein containing PAS domain S-box [Anaerolinea thermolimosa]|uniref:GAF domain-containing protein n=1 Tax=Anaerolinea thermolimosa TaxID=229919 RepID=UPI0009FF53DF|nr:GAF domain-containing protein [Anaerolinea thermolimosa]GAP05331.1 protein containing PAS domain S-box [Anaerolinea thermolimosa]
MALNANTPGDLSRELQVLHGIARAAYESQSEDELFERVTALIAETLYPHQFGVLLLNPETRHLVFHPSYRGLSEKFLSMQIPLGQGVTGTVALTGEPMNVPDVSRSEIFLEYEPNTGSELCVPLKVRGEVVGVIDAESALRAAFREEDERLMVTLAHQLGMALERLRSERDLRRRVAQLNALQEASRQIAMASLDAETVYATIHRVIASLMPFDALAITLWRPEQKEIEAVYLFDDGQRFPPVRHSDETGWSAYVLRTGVSLRIGDFFREQKIAPAPVHFGSQRRTRSVLAVPLRRSSRPMGVLLVQSYTPNRYTQEDLEMLEMVSGYVGVAVENSLLYEEAARQALTFANSFDAIILTDGQSRIIDWNPAAERMFGYRRHEVLGKPVWEVTQPPEEQQPVQNRIFRAMEENGRWDGEVPICRKDGSRGVVDLVVLPVYGANGELIATIGVNRDVTHLRQTERALRSIEVRLGAIVEQAAESIILADTRGRVVYVNPCFEETTGFPKAEVLGKSVRHLMSDYHDWSFYKELLRTVAGGHSWSGMLVSQRKDGTYLYENVTVFPIKDERGVAVNYAALKRDITAEIQREREMQAIQTVSTALRKAVNRSEMLPIILDQLMALLNARGALIAMLDGETNSLRVEIGRGVFSISEESYVPPGKGVTGLIFTRSAPFQTDDIEKEADYRPLDERLPEKGIRAVIGAPLVAQGETMGVLWVGRERPFLSEEFRVLQAVADMSANAMHRASLHERTLRYAEQTVAITAAGRVMSETLDRTEIYSHLSRSIQALLGGMNALAIYRLENDSEYCSCVYICCNGEVIEAEKLSSLSLVDVHTPPLDELFREHRPYILREPWPVFAEIEALVCSAPEKTSNVLVPMVARGRVIGFLYILSLVTERFSTEEMDLLSLVGSTAATAIENAELYHGLQRTNRELLEAYDSTIEGWSRALDLRDRETESHTQRVTELTLRVARRFGFSEEQLGHIRRGALLHDIGKMGVPDRILHKPEPLTPEEWMVMRMHPVYAYEMLSPIAYLRPALSIPYCHHEWWNGAGYPRGLKGEEIPLEARIFAVVDVYDALTSSRPYRPAWPRTQALRHILAETGTHFDPRVVEEFMRVVPSTFPLDQMQLTGEKSHGSDA